MTITQDILDEGKSRNGSWSWKQLKALGLGKEWFRLDGSLKSGWRQYLIGLNVPESNIKNFIALKNSHLRIETKQFWPVHKSQTELVAQMDADNLAHLRSIAL